MQEIVDHAEQKNTTGHQDTVVRSGCSGGGRGWPEAEEQDNNRVYASCYVDGDAEGTRNLERTPEELKRVRHIHTLGG